MDVSWMRPLTLSTKVRLSLAVGFIERLTVFPAAVNVLKPEVAEAWDSASKFDADKDKDKFRQYESACDRVKNFYREQHREYHLNVVCDRSGAKMSFREADRGLQRQGKGRLQEEDAGAYERVAGY